MVSRVFQKSGVGKKARISLVGSHYSESGGVPPSISSLPPLLTPRRMVPPPQRAIGSAAHTRASRGSPCLASIPPSALDSSPYGATTAASDRDSCSYESTEREPVPCFSTIVATIATSGLGHHRLSPPLASTSIARAPPGALRGRCSRASACSNRISSYHSSPRGRRCLWTAGAATAAMVCHGGVHHRVEEMGGNCWSSDLERMAWIPSSVAMDDPSTLDLVKEIVVHLLSTRSPSPSVDSSATAIADLPIAGGHG